MGRVSQETVDKLSAFIESLPEEVKSKCAFCNETLTHIVKKAEVETGAGTATITGEIAKKHNETAATHDKVSGKQLQDRVRYKEGKDKVGISENKQPTNTQIDHEEGTPDKPNPGPERNISEQVELPRKLPQISTLLEKATDLQKQFVNTLHQLGELSYSGSLKDDQAHKMMEDQLSLIITESVEVGLHPRGVPGLDQPKDSLEDLPRSARDLKILVIRSIGNRPQDDPGIIDALSEIINQSFTAIGNDALHQLNDDSIIKTVLPNPETSWGTAAIILNYLTDHFKNNCELTANNIDDDDRMSLECGFDNLKPYISKVLQEKYKDYRQ
jgi:hypothetical protein